MDRRLFLAAAGAAIAASPAMAANGIRYKRGLVEAELAAGNTVFLDFYADWCSTCRVQGVRIRNLMRANPAYEENITFIQIDWDRHARARISKELRIPRRSTLVALKGDAEIGRLIAVTAEEPIKRLMDEALAAATAGA